MGLAHSIKTLDPQKSGLHVVTDEELVEMHSILVDMLDDIKRVCDQNNIQWGISGGCALGAVRHQGFIPWDDDVDIIFTRNNFEKFKKVYPRECNSKYELICPGESGYYIHLPRIFNTETTAEIIQNLGRGKGLYIDIFVLENTYDNEIMRTIHGVFCTMYLFIISSVVTRKQKENFYKYGSEKLKKQVKLRSFFGTIFSFRKAETWIEKGIKVFSHVKNDNSKYVVSATGSGHYFGEIYEREKMCCYKDLIFEGKYYPFMEDVDYFCKMRFGDNYMELPPNEKREKHMYISLNLYYGVNNVKETI